MNDRTGGRARALLNALRPGAVGGESHSDEELILRSLWVDNDAGTGSRPENRRETNAAVNPVERFKQRIRQGAEARGLERADHTN